MTYNVHSCIGRDGRASHARIVDVIEEIAPDIIALQELDVGLFRSGLIDQARSIAQKLDMHFTFRPALFIEQGEYGNAILSRYPLQLIRSGELPSIPGRPDIEQRGILWSEIKVRNSFIQVMNTHLGLFRWERFLQARLITGPEWLGHPDDRPPVVFCGDLNSGTTSSVYRMLKRVLRDSQRGLNGWSPRRTWPSGFPIRRIDHIFVSRDLKVVRVDVPRTTLTRVASDHLPLVVEVEIPESGNAVS